MGTMIITVVVCILIPVLLLCGILEKKSRYIAIALCCGAVMCVAAYYINTLLYRLTGCTYYHLTTSVAPFVEESVKFIPILIYARCVSKEQHSLLTFAFATGLGFAIIENSYTLAESASTATVAWMLVRGIGTGLMHGMSTTIVGMGIYLASKEERLELTGTTATLFLAMMYHGAYNAMIQTPVIRYFGIFIPLVSYAVVFAVMNQDDIRKFLEE